MRLVAALGNGVFGRATRHSIGLRLLEELADAHGATWTWRFALFAHVARVSLDDDEEAVALVWPALPYNVIGYCVAAAAAELGLSAAAVTVVHDDLELAPGQIRFKDGGSAGGNNGLKSAIASLGTSRRAQRRSDRWRSGRRRLRRRLLLRFCLLVRQDQAKSEASGAGGLV